MHKLKDANLLPVGSGSASLKGANPYDIHNPHASAAKKKIQLMPHAADLDNTDLTSPGVFT